MALNELVKVEMATCMEVKRQPGLLPFLLSVKLPAACQYHFFSMGETIWVFDIFSPAIRKATWGDWIGKTASREKVKQSLPTAAHFNDTPQF